MNDAIRQFQDFLAEKGLGRPDIIPDGIIHRFHIDGDKAASENGAYKFHSDGIQAGYFKNWRTGQDGTWCAMGHDVMTQAERDIYSNFLTKAKADDTKARAEEQREAAQRARDVWEKAAPLGEGQSHPYLVKKGVKPHGDVRLDNGRLVLAVLHAETGELQSLQHIDAIGGKRLFKGGRKSEGIILVHGDIKEASLIALVEGYATGCTVAEAMGCPADLAVEATVDAGNMPRVAAMLKARRPSAQFIVCGDNDRKTEAENGKNPGREAAEKAASLTGGRAVFPPAGEAENVDWNDYAANHGLDSAREALTVWAENPSSFHGDLAEWARQNFMDVSEAQEDIYSDGEKVLVRKTACPVCQKEASLNHGASHRVEYVHAEQDDQCELKNWVALRSYFEPSFKLFVEESAKKNPLPKEVVETGETVETGKAPSGTTPKDSRERVVVSTCEARTADRAVAILHKETELFQRGGSLVRVVEGDAGPSILDAKAPWLRDALSRQARFVRLKVYKDGSTDEVPCLVPEWLVSIVLERRGAWPGVRNLRAVVETPIFLPGGRILTEPGYDPDTGILFKGRPVNLDVPSHPTRADAEAACATLFDIVSDFPFAEAPSPEAHRAAWLANLLTLAARFAIDGPVPFFIYDASLRGSGKGILSTLTSIIALGHPTPTSQASGDQEELRKNLLPLVSSGKRMVLLDELGQGFGGRFWNNLVTAWPFYSDRILGKSEVMTAPAFTVWMCTGNGVTLAAESTRRAIPIRLEPLTDKPEDRTGFKYPDLIHHVHEVKGRLLGAALTILAAYHAEGCPCADRPPLGSFESWSRIVRNSVLWITGEDPVSTQRTMASMLDEHDAAAATVIRHAAQTFTGQFSAKRFLESAVEDDIRFALDILRSGRQRREDLTVKGVGRVLNKLRGRVSEGKRLMVSGDSSLKTFYIVPVNQSCAECAEKKPSQGNEFLQFVEALK